MPYQKILMSSTPTLVAAMIESNIAADRTQAPAMLSVKHLRAWYDESQIIHDISFEVREGEVVTLLGRNGAGKTTTLRSIMGMVTHAGSIEFRGQDLSRLRSHEIARLGIGYVPEERGIYASLTVAENLVLPPKIDASGLSIEEIFTLFPNLKERRKAQGTSLSGGEQQMLSIARILRTGARFLLLDEPTEGLAPVIVKQIALMIEQLKARKFTIVLVEQNSHFASRIADRHVVIEHGHTVDMLTRDNAATDPDRLKRYLAV
jgi:branched-chain amino acid transport system ATP-binding protein